MRATWLDRGRIPEVGSPDEALERYIGHPVRREGYVPG